MARRKRVDRRQSSSQAGSFLWLNRAPVPPGAVRPASASVLGEHRAAAFILGFPQGFLSGWFILVGWHLSRLVIFTSCSSLALDHHQAKPLPDVFWQTGFIPSVRVRFVIVDRPRLQGRNAE